MIEPIYTQKLTTDLTIAVFGNQHGYNWSCPDLRNPHARLTLLASEQFNRLKIALQKVSGDAHLSRIFLSKLGLEQRIATEKDYHIKISDSSYTVTVHKTYNFFDATVLPFGTALGMRSGDCHTLVLYAGNKVVAGHISRDTLLNPKAIKEGRIVSILDVMRKEFTSFTPGSIKAFIACGISGESFIHPVHILSEHRKKNKTLFKILNDEYGYPIDKSRLGQLDIPWIIKEHLVQRYRIRPEHVQNDDIDTFRNIHCHSHKRGDLSRNLVLIIHR